MCSRQICLSSCEGNCIGLDFFENSNYYDRGLKDHSMKTLLQRNVDNWKYEISLHHGNGVSNHKIISEHDMYGLVHGLLDSYGLISSVVLFLCSVSLI